MITINEIGEGLAEHENRLSFLENSLPFTTASPEIPNRELEPEWSTKQWAEIQQMKAEILHWRKQHANTLKEIDILKAKVDRTRKTYKEYI